MIIYNDINRLKSTVIKFVSNNPKSKIISIDGWVGAGKTHLVAPAIKNAINWDVIDGDKEFLIPNVSREYVFNAPKIKSLFSKDEKIIIDSVLITDIFQIANRQPDLSIYVKRINNSGEWIDEHITHPSSNIDKLFTYYSSPFQRQLIQYHRLKKPHESPDIIYLNQDPHNADHQSMLEMFVD